MSEKSYFLPYLRDEKVVIEEAVFDGLPFDRFWYYRPINMSWEDKRAAAIGDSEMCNLYEPYCLSPNDYLVYKDDADLRKQLYRFAQFNTVMRYARHLNTTVECERGSVDVVVFPNEVETVKLMDTDHSLTLNDLLLTITFEEFEDEDDLEKQLRELVEKISTDLSGYAWELFPSRLGEIDTIKLACALLRANARAKLRQDLSDENIHHIMLGAMVENVMGYDETLELNQDYDVFAEGILAVSNHLGMNQFFA